MSAFEIIVMVACWLVAASALGFRLERKRRERFNQDKENKP